MDHVWNYMELHEEKDPDFPDRLVKKDIKLYLWPKSVKFDPRV